MDYITARDAVIALLDETAKARNQVDTLLAENARLRECLLFVRDECDWEEPKGDFGGGGDSRIGPAISAVLEDVDSGSQKLAPTQKCNSTL